MTRIDETQVPSAAEIYRKYQDLLRKAAQNEEGRSPSLRDTQNSKSISTVAATQANGFNSEEMKMAEASRDFEALFIQQMFSEMRRGLREDSVLGDKGGSLAADRNQNSFFRDQMYQKISEDMANQGGFGIGAVLFEQLYHQEHPEVLPNSSQSQAAAVTPKSKPAATDSVYKLLEQQRQTLQQKQYFSQAQLESRFDKS